MNFDGGCQNLAAQGGRAFFIREGFHIQINRFADVRERFFDRGALRLAALEFGAPGVTTVRVPLNDNAYLSRH